MGEQGTEQKSRSYQTGMHGERFPEGGSEKRYAEGIGTGNHGGGEKREKKGKRALGKSGNFVFMSTSFLLRGSWNEKGNEATGNYL